MFLAPFIAVTVMYISLILILYVNADRIVNTSANEALEAFTRQTVAEIDHRITIAVNESERVLMSPEAVTCFIGDSTYEASSQFYKIVDLCNLLSLNQNFIKDDLIVDYLIINPDKNLVVSAKHSYLRMNYFFKDIFYCDNNEYIFSFNSAYIDSSFYFLPETTINYYGNKYNVIPYFFTQHSVAALKNTKTISVLLLNVDKIREKLLPIFDGNVQKIDLHTIDGIPLLNSSERQSFNTNSTYTSITCVNNKLLLRINTPKNYANDVLAIFRQRITLSTIIFFLLNALVVAKITYSNSRPVIPLYEYYKNHFVQNGKKLSFRIIQDSISETGKDLIKMRNVILNHQQIILAEFARKLINGTELKHEDINIAKSILPQFFTYFKHFILVVEMQRSVELRPEQFQDLLDLCDIRDTLMFQEFKNRVVFVVGCNNEPWYSDSLKSKIYMICEKVAYYLSDDALFLYVGKPENDLNMIVNSYFSAIEMITPSNKPGIYYCDEELLVNEPTSFDYSLKTEASLIKAIFSGNVNQSIHIMERIKNNNTYLPKISQKQLINAIENTLLRFNSNAISQYGFFTSITIAKQENQFDKAFALLTNIILDISKKYARSDDDNYEQRILQFMQENYSNSELTLADLATHMGQKESTLYNYLRTKYNKTFFQIAEEIRMNKAKQLLALSELKVDKISELVGYVSTHSFRRAFKRAIGLTPLEYRNNCSLKTNKL